MALPSASEIALADMMMLQPGTSRHFAMFEIALYPFELVFRATLKIESQQQLLEMGHECG